MGSIETQLSLAIGNDHRNRGIVTHHPQVEAEVRFVAAAQSLHGLGKELHLLGFFIAQPVEELLGVVHRFRPILHGLRPELDFLPFLQPYAIHDTVAVPEGCPNDQHGHYGQHQFPALFARIEVHAGVKFAIAGNTSA